ncbi:DUF2336 domain-containing protein [Agaricicola taiwanensis]|nr:DUF2336 domain-containing protein [Agaricicola taiwanensis]
MIIRRFLHWARTAPVEGRIQAARALGRAYVQDVLGADETLLAEAAMTSLLDDPSADVRQALAEAIAASPRVPRHIITALCEDNAEVAAPVLALSPLLTTADLVDHAASHDSLVQSAVAARADLPAPVAAALAEVGGSDACAILVRNSDAVLTPSAMKRLVERHASHADVREALLERKDLPIHIQQSLVRAVAENLSSLVSGRKWMSKAHADVIAGRACEKATVTLASERAGQPDMPHLVRHLRETGQLTPALLLRALAAGNIDFFETVLSELSGLERSRISNLIRDGRSNGFAMLYRRVELPKSAYPAFRAAIDDLVMASTPADAIAAATQLRRRLSRMYEAQAAAGVSDFDPVQMLLRDLLAEAGRQSARLVADKVISMPSLTAA